ncbi:hypothetical protein XFF6166_520017 [Xanthomonas citri pv. fuscans]|nr:hypothetical protein XFF6166_520017 [Xanthomonas citri pv. fuscans]SON98832.1 hypothetical protein XFF7767_1060070 [Xanthomonas citri pv. fuscans]SOO01413.1 hypothetical protein XFF6960_480041 [Xanthomonas citri pv. fuscans]SOO09977.1 hypothetical protein XFF6970_490112 [Xanthomonas citri pv. fuscans]SOO13953.1 hypothetical protein XFF7766_260056 [Xanthomonas citri pv. fuscans]
MAFRSISDDRSRRWQPNHTRTGHQFRTSGTACDLLSASTPQAPPVGADAASVPGRARMPLLINGPDWKAPIQ